MKTLAIKKTPQVNTLIERWENYTKDFIPSNTEEKVLQVLPKLSDWEKVVLYAMSDSEYKTVKKVAALFGFPETRTFRTMVAIRTKIKAMLKEEEE